MSLFIQNTERSSELQKRITAELTDMAKKKSIGPKPKDIDGVNDSEYIKDLQQSKIFKLNPTWWVLILLTAIVVMVIIVLAVKGI